MIKLVLPSYEYEADYNDYIKEVLNNGEESELGNIYRPNESYNQMLNRIHKRRYGIDISTNDVPSTIYFIVKNNRIVGSIDLRSYLNKSYFFKYGHIAYIIRPSCRNQKIGAKALAEALKIYKSNNVDKVLIVCYKENIASGKIIQNNGGKLEREFLNKSDNKIIQRWWIDID